MGNKKSIFLFVLAVLSSLLPRNSTVICGVPWPWAVEQLLGFLQGLL